MKRKPITVRIARWSAAHPWRAVALWVVFVAACSLGGGAAGLNEATDADRAVGEARRADLIAEAGRFPAEPARENVLITARSGDLNRPNAERAAADAAGRLRQLSEVTEVGDPMFSVDGTALLVPVSMGGDPKTAFQRVEPLLTAVAGTQSEFPDLRVEQVGEVSIDKSMKDTLDQDYARAEVLSVPLTLVILVIAFGALIAAAVPVLLALSCVGAAIGLTTIASHLVPSTDATVSVVLLIGMAVGVDYSLFYVRREREERAKGRDQLTAVEITAETSGHSVVVSGTAVLISMLGLFFAGDGTFASLAIGSILVVAVAVLGSVTVLPALLMKLGRWIDRPRVPFLWRLSARATQHREGRAPESRFWSFVLRPALRRPAVTLAVSALVLLALAAPALQMTLAMGGIEDIPRTTPVMQGYDRLTAAFPSQGTTHTVTVRAGAGQAPAVQTALTGMAGDPRGAGLFGPVDPNGADFSVSPDGRVVILELASPHEPRSDEAREGVELLRGTLVPDALDGVPGVEEYAVGGEVAGSLDYTAQVWRKMPIVVGFVLLFTFIIMAWTFRSPVIALTSIVLNLLSAGAAIGILVLVFQGTWAESLLQFESIGAVVTWLPLFLFVVLFGLSMDYHVFVVSRIREAALGGLPNREAVAHGVTTSAGVVTSAAIVMVGVFSIFATLSTIDMKQLGVGLAVAILLDATIIRAVVLPSAMTLLGRANWWTPRILRGRAPAEGRHTAAPEHAPENTVREERPADAFPRH